MLEQIQWLEGMYAPGCESLEQARIQTSPGAPRTGEGEETMLEQIQWLRSFRKAGGGKYRAGIRENGF
jgi:hypothetical protein